MKTCPYCGSEQMYPTRIEEERGQKREYPTTFLCGTITSPNWSPPIRGRVCSGEELRLIDIWYLLDSAKARAVKLRFDAEQCATLKAECDDLFRQAGGGDVCPAYWIGFWR